jgi:hypothetical protein
MLKPPDWANHSPLEVFETRRLRECFQDGLFRDPTMNTSQQSFNRKTRLGTRSGGPLAARA